MTRKELLPHVEALVADAKAMFDRVAVLRPESVPTAQMCVDDITLVYFLVESARGKLSASRRLRIGSLLMRATLLSEALNVEPQ